jgi:arylformamidase
MFDLTFPLDRGTPTFPGDPPIRVQPVRTLERGDPYRLSTVSLGSHSGTHLDAPSHFVPGGPTLDAVDLELLNGPVWVVALPEDRTSVAPEDLAAVPPGATRVLVRTGNSRRWAEGSGFFEPFVALEPPAAQAALRQGVRLLGVDGLSVESDPTRRFPVHHALLSGGCWILEGLRLSGVTGGAHRLGCLPIRLAGSDGAPCRAVLWE